MELTKSEFIEKMDFVKMANQVGLSLSKHTATNSDEFPIRVLCYGFIVICQEIVHCMYEDYFPCTVEGVVINKPL